MIINTDLIRSVEIVMPCPKCGRPNPVSMIYCEDETCTAELHPGKETCRKCRASLPGNAKFCRDCGQATRKAPSAIGGMMSKAWRKTRDNVKRAWRNEVIRTMATATTMVVLLELIKATIGM